MVKLYSLQLKCNYLINIQNYLKGRKLFKKESGKLLVLFLIGFILLPVAIVSFLRKS